MSLSKLSLDGKNFGQEQFNSSRPGRVWLVTSRLGTGKMIIFFTVYLKVNWAAAHNSFGYLHYTSDPLECSCQRVLNELYVEGQASLWSYDLAPRPPFPTPSPVGKLDRRHTERLRKRGKLLTGEGGAGWAWSRIIRPQESMALYKPFNYLRSMCSCIQRLNSITTCSVEYMQNFENWWSTSTSTSTF